MGSEPWAGSGSAHREPREPRESSEEPREPGEPREEPGEPRDAVADGADPAAAGRPAGRWRNRLRRLLPRPMGKDAALGVIAGMGLLIFVDPVLVFGREGAPGEEAEIVLPRQRPASD